MGEEKRGGGQDYRDYKEAVKWYRMKAEEGIAVAQTNGASGKTIVFGLLKRNGKVYTRIVPNCSRATLQAVGSLLILWTRRISSP